MTNGFQIAVFDSGFVFVGFVKHEGDIIQIHDSRVIRRWGTTHGLGELANKGPLPNTKLEAVCYNEMPLSKLIVKFMCNKSAWGIE